MGTSRAARGVAAAAIACSVAFSQMAGCQTEGQVGRSGPEPLATANVQAPSRLSGSRADQGVPHPSPEPRDLLNAHPVKLVSVENAQDEAPRLALSELIELAVASSPDLAVASEQLRLADAALERARAEFYPTLQATQSYGVTNNPVTSFSYQLNQANLTFAQDFNRPPVIDDFNTKVRLQHSLYTGGRRTYQEQAADASRRGAALQVAAVHNQLVFRIAEAFYRLLQADHLLAVRAEAVRTVEQHLQIVQARFRAETAVRSDVLNVQVRLAQVREDLISAENQRDLAWAVLENVVGASVPRRELPATVPPAPWDEAADSISDAVAAALRQRPETDQLQASRRAAASQISVARAGKKPTLALTTDYDVYTGDFREGNDSFFVGLVLGLNLFDGGRTRAETDQALAKLRTLEAQQRRLVADIELDVRRAYLQVRDAEARHEVAIQAAELARESLREIESRYRGQSATLTELMDAQVARSAARVRLVAAEADVEVARAALQRSVGRLTQLTGRGGS